MAGGSVIVLHELASFGFDRVVVGSISVNGGGQSSGISNRSILAIPAIEKIGRDRIIVNGSRVMIIRLGLIIKE